MIMKYFVQEFVFEKPWRTGDVMTISREQPWNGQREGSSDRAFKYWIEMYPQGTFKSYIKTVEYQD